MYKVYIGCLPASCTSEQLRTFFEQFGKILEVRIVKKSNKLCAGNGVLTCADRPSFDRILSEKEYTFNGRTIFCGKLLSGEELQVKNKELSLRRVFVSNLPSELEDQQLELAMARFGEVQNAYRIKSLKKEKRPFGFVTFLTSQAAAAAVSKGQIQIKNHVVYIAEFKKNERQKVAMSDKSTPVTKSTAHKENGSADTSLVTISGNSTHRHHAIKPSSKHYASQLFQSHSNHSASNLRINVCLQGPSPFRCGPAPAYQTEARGNTQNIFFRF